MSTEMPIIDYTNETDIKWQPLNLFKEVLPNGKTKKSPMSVNTGTYSFMPVSTDFTTDLISQTTLLKRQACIDSADYIAHDTTMVQILDVDDLDITEEQKELLIGNSPYYESVIKKLPHVFVLLEDKEKFTKGIYKSRDNDKIEILNGQWAWCGKDTIVKNADKPIRTLSSFFLKDDKLVKPSIVKNKKIVKNVKGTKLDFEVPHSVLTILVNNLNKERAIEFENWSKVVWSIYNIAYENNYLDKGIKLIHKFSKTCESYSKDDVDNFINNRCSYKQNGYQYGTLIHLLKEDEESIFREINDYMNLHNNSYAKVKERFERNKFKVMGPLSYVVVKDDQTLQIYKKLCFKDAYENLYYYVDEQVKDKSSKKKTDTVSVTKKKPFIKDWFLDENIKTYNNIDFLPPPLHCPVKTFNLWSGFEIENKVPYVDNVDYETDIHVQKFKNHLLVLHNNNTDHCKRTLDWLAHKIQFPAKKIESAILYKGEEGTGKNSFSDCIKNMFGTKLYFETGNAGKEVFGTFSVAGKHKLINVINESNGKDNCQHWEKLKHMITSKEQWYEEKGVQMFPLIDLRDFIFFTNNDFCLPISNRQRRFFPIETSEELKGNTEYFTDFYNTIVNNDIALRKIFQFFQDLEITTDFRDVPETELSKDIIENNLDYETKFLRWFCYKMADTHKMKFTMTNEQFFAEWQEFLTKHSITITGYNALKFGIRINRKKIWGIERPETIKKDKYIFEIGLIFDWLINRKIMGPEGKPEIYSTNVIVDQAEDKI